MELSIAYYTLCVLAAVFLTPPLVFYLLLSLRPKASQPKNAKLQTSSWWTFKQIG